MGEVIHIRRNAPTYVPAFVLDPDGEGWMSFDKIGDKAMARRVIRAELAAGEYGRAKELAKHFGVRMPRA
jgi:hypothetical protein